MGICTPSDTKALVRLGTDGQVKRPGAGGMVFESISEVFSGVYVMTWAILGLLHYHWQTMSL